MRGSWDGDKLGKIRKGILKWLGADRLIEQGLDDRLDWKLPTAPKQEQSLLNYRQQENKLWATSSADRLYQFYKTVGESHNVMINRQPFWRWIGGQDNVAKIHYPAAESLLNHMKSLLFGADVIDEVLNKDGTVNEKLQKRLELAHEENNIHSLRQNSSYLETYSGTLGYKYVIDTEVGDTPIIVPYPAERMEFTSKYGRALEVIFKDYYTKGKIKYVLRSIYGYGYIRYELRNDKGKLYDLNTLEETQGLRDVTFQDSQGKPIKLLMASWKQNRTHSNEFPELLYGGSDFEGIIDNFHTIDEIASTKTNYFRKSRPIQAFSKDALEQNKYTGAPIYPKEYELDAFTVAPTMNADDVKKLIFRDIPEINIDPFDRAIISEYKTIYQYVGMAHSSVGLEAIPSNVSNESLTTMEKSTIVLRDNKIKLWIPFIQHQNRLLLIYQDVIDSVPNDSDPSLPISYRVTNLYEDVEFNVEFPDYNNQSMNERIDLAIKLYQGGIADLYTCVRIVFTDLDEEEAKRMVLRIKQEQGNVILPSDLEDMEDDINIVEEDEEVEVEEVIENIEEVDDEDGN